MKIAVLNRFALVGLSLVGGCSLQPTTDKGIEPPLMAVEKASYRIEQSVAVRDMITGERVFVFCSGTDCQLTSRKSLAASARPADKQTVAPSFAGPKYYSIAFAYDSSTLSQEALKALGAVVEEAKTAKQIRIIGKADSVKRDTYNRSLAQRRADAVKRYLVAKGVAIPIGSSADIVRVTPEGVYPPGEKFNGRRVDLELIVEVVKP